MESLFLLVPLSVLLVLAIGVLFWRALRGGQFDDLERPAHDLLMDDDSPAAAEPGARRAGAAAHPPGAIDLDQAPRDGVA